MEREKVTRNKEAANIRIDGKITFVARAEFECLSSSGSRSHKSKDHKQDKSLLKYASRQIKCVCVCVCVC
jgi:hypothetical protein